MITQNSGAPGDLKKFIVKIGDKDVSDAVISAHVFQDILSPNMTCIVNFNDTNNLLMNLPIRANDKITVNIQTELDSIGDGEQEWEFVIYRIGDKQMANSKQLKYSVYAADKAYILNQTKRIYKSFSDMKVSDIAGAVVQEYLGGELVVHPTDNSSQVIIPGWTPLYTLSWLLKSALKSGSADYTFFQSFDGKYNFKSFEQLYSSGDERADVTFKIRPTNFRDDNGDIDQDYATLITSYSFEHFDAFSNMGTGFYKNKTVSFDFINKEWTSKTFTFGDDNSEDKKYKDFDDDLLSGIEEANISFIPKHPGMTGKSTYLDNADVWAGSRKSAVQKFMQERLQVQVMGSAKAAEWFAKNVEVDLPSQDFESDEEYDKQRRGRWLISAMAHMINKDAYVINIEFVKKRLEAK